MRLFLATVLLSAPLYAQFCEYTLSPTSVSVPATASTGQISVTTLCGWNPIANVTWLHITSGPGGSGNGTASYSTDANTAGTPRVGTISIGGQTVTITQAAAVCTFEITPKSQTVPVGGATGSFALKATCSWNASSN